MFICFFVAVVLSSNIILSIFRTDTKLIPFPFLIGRRAMRQLRKIKLVPLTFATTDIWAARSKVHYCTVTELFVHIQDHVTRPAAFHASPSNKQFMHIALTIEQI